jgi:leucyl aminopeptidase
MTDIFPADPASAHAARIVSAPGLDAALKALPAATAAHARAAGFRADPGEVVVLDPASGGLSALIGAGAARSEHDAADAAMKLPEGDWLIESWPEGWDATRLAAALAVGGYQFTRYRKAKRPPARFVLPEGADGAEASRIAKAVALTRDLVNTPAIDMLPSHLEAAARALADQYGAEFSVIEGEALLEQNTPLHHTGGRAAADAPRLIEFEWGDPSHPRLALVGKGVCFDSGGLNIKPGGGMRWMKKDMGGAANVLGLASLIMDAKLPVRLHVLIPAVENAIAGNAFRPGDILPSRKGLTVEIGNTDAEGRLVLADALTKACEAEPELVIDMATLTGAARVAIGPEIAPFYTADDALAEQMHAGGRRVDDPVWRMPLWDGYDPWIESDVADISNSADTPFAGSLTAALFLRRFVDAPAWMHLDIFAWNAKPRPGRPVGGEMLGARAVWDVLKQRYGGSANG